MNGLLWASLVVALAVILYALLRAGGEPGPETLLLAAAAFAVVGSTVSALASQKVLQLEEEARLPYVAVELDPYSRYGLIQVKLTNRGGTRAHKISLDWNHALRDKDGNVVGGYPVAALAAGESAYFLVDTGTKLMREHPPGTSFEGTLSWKDVHGHKYQESFSLGFDHLRGSYYYTLEEKKTAHRLQEIPGCLQDIAAVLKALTDKYHSDRSA